MSDVGIEPVRPPSEALDAKRQSYIKQTSAAQQSLIFSLERLRDKGIMPSQDVVDYGDDERRITELRTMDIVMDSMLELGSDPDFVLKLVEKVEAKRSGEDKSKTRP